VTGLHDAIHRIARKTKDAESSLISQYLYNGITDWIIWAAPAYRTVFHTTDYEHRIFRTATERGTRGSCPQSLTVPRLVAPR
jgi:hypothetical protein